MKASLLLAILLFSLSAPAQYYYKDIVGSTESADLIRLYQKHGVSRVGLIAYDNKNQADKDFFVEQVFNPTQLVLRTTTRSGVTNESVLTSFSNAKGFVIRTLDSSDAVKNETLFNYDDLGHLTSVTMNSGNPDNSFRESEVHVWTWSGNTPQRMVRIKNGKDSTFVTFKTDSVGNVIEENEVHKGVAGTPVYYYYNENKQMTDIVRFSKRANRLLPEYMFVYTEAGQVAQKITVPDNNSEYLIWRYQYNVKGLKTKEAIYNRQKKLTGKIEYQYTFGS